jgi:hypothetical protein
LGIIAVTAFSSSAPNIVKLLKYGQLSNKEFLSNELFVLLISSKERDSVVTFNFVRV